MKRWHVTKSANGNLELRDPNGYLGFVYYGWKQFRELYDEVFSDEDTRRLAQDVADKFWIRANF